jgi:outer membrane biosynthesis protein TonB
MAAPLRVPAPDRREPMFDMRSLRRLGVWGASATLALVLAVVAGYAGSRRHMAEASPANGPMPAQKGDAQGAQRSPDLDIETRRLADAVRALANDRERLLTRIGTLERNLEDMTGSIKREPATASPTPPPPETSSAPPQKPKLGATEAAAQGPPQAPAPGSAKPSVASPGPQPAEPARPQTGGAEAPERVATLTAVAPESVSETGQADLGVDIGSAANFDGLRVLWTSTKGNNAALFEGLHPQVVVRENGKTKGPELRLVVGPIADIEAAARMCATLSAGRRYCQPVAFEGQRLADADVVPERKVVAAPERKPAAAKPKPAPAPEPKILRFFR